MKMRRISTVSYTHLDVYKRQVLGNSTATGTTSGNNLADNTYDLAQCVTYENWKKK